MRHINIILKKLNSGSTRSVIIKKNILGSIFIKGLSILTSLLLVPVTLNLLDKEKYGIWITLYTVVTWFNMMDIGLGNGFRNKFAEALAMEDKSSAQKFIETIYSSTIIISIGFFSVYSLMHPFLNWNSLLNIPKDFDENLSTIVWVVFGLFSLQLILKNITTILLSIQKTALSNALILIGNILSLIVIWIFGITEKANLQTISFAFMVMPLIVYTFATIILFSKKIIPVVPNTIKFHKEYFRSMMSLGIKFFFIQITTIVMFSSGNFIIAQLYGPSDVTPYNISYRLFASTLSIFTILIAPFWTAYTEAITKRDFEWIKRVLKNLNKMWILFATGILFILLLSPWIFRIWLGDNLQIPLNLSASFAIYALLLSWSGMFSQFLNGVGKIKIQLYISIFQCLTNIPLAILLAKNLGIGISGVILATNLNLLFAAVILPIQVYKITNIKASGIWNK
ncbi:lipopolysaccharide biosynthesis protein [Mangrovibacterium lignilyticum]|uniref:lipopolysaccharide biosynthesis protein n=1 Tax=Mangrovibacterium lignilyticum TaxID=2668052 RepID=UPI0013D1E03A|nr:MATE family efflux transporter [Mangrovibacterium lignilyticum]